MNTQALAWMERHRSFPSTPVFFALWPACGFFLGTLTLLGPVRAWTKMCRGLELSPHIENGGVFALIAALFMVSGYTARIVTNFLETSDRKLRVMTITGAVVVCGSAIGAWMNPALMAANMGAERHTERFVFGPYPDEARLMQLKRDGYTVVSLLHPAVVPFEPKLIRDEKKLAEGIGIPLIEAPMLPWISSNVESLARIRELAADGSRRFYVHCYLGQDRVRVVQHMLEETGVSMVAVTRSHRSIRDRHTFVRGRIERLAPDVYLTAYPTDEEFLYLASGEIKQVVALLDDHDPEQRALLERERALMRDHHVPFTFVQSDLWRYDSHRAAIAAAMIAQMPRPVLVHGYLSPSSGHAPWADGLAQSFATRRAALPPTLFADPLGAGRASVVVAHVAIGPRPRRTDFMELKRRGVVECVHVGARDARSDATLARRAGMRWRNVPAAKLVASVAKGGPFYVYGTGSAALRGQLEHAYRKPIVFTP